MDYPPIPSALASSSYNHIPAVPRFHDYLDISMIDDEYNTIHHHRQVQDNQQLDKV
jgi:hypothetical protein